MSNEIECPFCGTEFEIDSEDLPARACDDEIAECPGCGNEFKFGWHVDLEVRQRVLDDDKVLPSNEP